jgi:hypothetical protein
MHWRTTNTSKDCAYTDDNKTSYMHLPQQLPLLQLCKGVSVKTAYWTTVLQMNGLGPEGPDKQPEPHKVDYLHTAQGDESNASQNLKIYITS